MICRQSVSRSHRGEKAGRCPFQPRSQVYPARPPVAAFKPLGDPLGRFPAVGSGVHLASRGSVDQEGDKFLKLYPGQRSTFNQVQ